MTLNVAKGLQIFGAVSVAVITVGIGHLIYTVISNVDRKDSATNQSVEFILNWGGLKTSQQFKVLGSFESARSLTGDHLDYYCLQLSDFSPSANEKENWQPLSGLHGPFREAAVRAFDAGNASRCFGRTDSRPPDTIVTYIWSIVLHSRSVTAYDVILFDPSSQRLLYVSDKT